MIIIIKLFEILFMHYIIIQYKEERLSKVVIEYITINNLG